MKSSKGNSIKTGVTKSRSLSATPAGLAKSGIPKYKPLESTKKCLIPKGKRPPSIEKISRVSLASNRNTPNKFATPVQNNKFLTLPSTNSKRQSSDTVRSSFGGKSRKEGFPVGDASFKTQCIDKLIDFFVSRHYDQPYDRNMIKLPSGKDFASIFSFIYQFIDPNYKLPLRFEDDLPRLLKALKYPVQMSRSSFLNVGSPHSWPSVLAMLAWLIDVIASYDCFNPEYVVFVKDFDEPIDLNEKRFNLLISAYLDNVSKQEEYLEEFKQFVYEVGGLLSNDMIFLQHEEEKLKNEIENIPDTKSQIIILQQQYNQLIEDKEKLWNFIQEMKNHISVKDNERVQHNMELEEKEGDARQVLNLIEKIHKLKCHQNMNASELKKFKNHATEVVSAINHQQNEEKDLQEEIYSTQMEISKNQQIMSSIVCKYNLLCNGLQLENCEITSSNFEGFLTYLEENILPVLKLEKRKIKELTFDALNLVKVEKTNKDKVEDEVQELEKVNFKLERKIKRLEEETTSVKDEMILEEHQLQEECDKLNEEVSQARRIPKSSLYEMQCELEGIKKEYENLYLKDRKERTNGKEFICQCYQYFKNFLLEIDERNEQHSIDMMESQSKHLEEIFCILQSDI